MANDTKRSLKTKIWFESFLATILVFGVIWVLFYIINISFKPFNYVTKALKEVQLTDIYFSQLHNDNADTTIILVNIENIDRSGIANLIKKINQAGPKVIAIDVFFSKDVEVPGDSLLDDALQSAGSKVVLAEFLNPENNQPDTTFKIFQYCEYGHANLPNNEDGTEVVRSFFPVVTHDNKDKWAFSAVVAGKYSPESFEKLKSRNKNEELINFTGDILSYAEIQHDDIMRSSDASLKFIKNKIVILGFTGGKCRQSSDIEDLFYTPVNRHYYGRSHPDMYGAVIHANIISMILKGNYIQLVPEWLVICISFVLVYFHVVLFIWLFVRHHIWYHLAVKLIQLISFAFILLGIFYLFRLSLILVYTKYMLLGVILSVDILYFYEALALIAHRTMGSRSFFIEHHEVKNNNIIEKDIDNKL